ncbi:GNAT family N-acetyltransferase [Cognatiyoonia sp. IB215446]|uniref:GNAT family N-acetyltransferase n=1 Tax=Cognatiyoonia sp. IB215446 TaxID=3097355 RepID=UPI002A10CEFF|nr:GNAT family N-acetyltransferase [Cognatiyoonia sp. IB215446]MDX8350079.1 GNAT family N-acetyltransferase [Cognatiyoonia sp. IB215446]
MIPATEADRAEIETFLRARLHQAMFPLNNLAEHGMAGGHDYAVSFWIARQAGQITDVLTLTQGGMVMPLLPSSNFADAAVQIRGRKLSGMVGPVACVRGLERQGLTDLPRSVDADEPQFLLDLSNLSVPAGTGQLRPLSEAPADVIKSWIWDYDRNTLNAPLARLDARVERTYDRYLANASHTVLMDGQTPLAMTGFNAQLPETVQLGGVYTPPELRNRGHARRAVAVHLAEGAAQGVNKATLFSASPAAARAYRALGFEKVGTWTLILFKEAAT